MRKKLFAILMSAMMMVTFMPAMAFATQDVQDAKWAADGSSVTLNGTTYTAGIVRTFNPVTGCITAQIPAGTYSTDPAVGYYSFFDLTGATVNCYSYYTSVSAFEGKFDPDEATTTVNLDLVKPSYAVLPAGQTATTASNITLTSGDATVGTVHVETPLYDHTLGGEQSFTLTPVFTPASNANTTVINADKVSGKAVKVAAEQISGDLGYQFYRDGVAIASGNASHDYDGKEHVLTIKTNSNVSVAVKLWNGSAWVDAESVTVKDVKNYLIKVVKTVTDATGNKTVSDPVTYTYRVNALSNVVGFAFEDYGKTATGGDKRAFEVVEGYNPADYVEVTGVATTADKPLFKEYFNDFYKFTKTTVKNSTVENQAFALDREKIAKLTTAERDALVAKYKTLLANYNITVARTTITTNGILYNTDDADFSVNAPASDIEWTKAPLTKKYYNKKGTLAKTYTFAVEAKADSKVTYKLTNGGEMIKIDKNTGKVTVKKGLKVGTYKVYVTAKAGSSKDTYTLTIKMAKK